MSPTEQHLLPWLYRCPFCLQRISLLNQARYNGANTVGWNPTTAAAMSGVRVQAARHLLKQLSQPYFPRAGVLLDVGCGPGWFLDAAREFGFDAFGIEPDAAIAKLARAQGREVLTGFFPHTSLPQGADVIIFNDVFEHLDAPRKILKAAYRQLHAGGIIVVNVPSSEGFLYRVSERLAQLGWLAPLERMWQRGFDSPHLFYFPPDSLRELMNQTEFEQVDEFDLNPLVLNGLWGRIRASKNLSLPVAGAIYLAALCTIPLRLLVKPDGIVMVFQKPEDADE